MSSTEDIERARYILKVAAKYIRLHCPYDLIAYDEADCDGMCLAEDCETAANCLPELPK